MELGDSTKLNKKEALLLSGTNLKFKKRFVRLGLKVSVLPSVTVSEVLHTTRAYFFSQERNSICLVNQYEKTL